MSATSHYWRDDALPHVELRSTYASLQGYKPHFHPQLSFGAMLAGTTRASCCGHERLLLAGDLVLIAPHVVHACNPVARQPRSYHMLYLDAAWCLESISALQGRSLADRFGSILVMRDRELFSRYLALVANIAELHTLDVSAQLQRLLSDVVGRHPPTTRLPQSPQLAERIKQELLENIESPPGLDVLAHAFGCRKETLIRVFRRAFHTTPHAFVNNARVEQAKQRLKAGEPIAHVAAELGFSDQAQLHRNFVSYTASTPGQYRRARWARVNFRQ